MEAKDTVMSDDELVVCSTKMSTREFAQAQAEISFKAGWEAHKKIVPEQLKAHGDICYKTARREVVEWLEQYAIHGGTVSLNTVLEDIRTHSPYSKPELKKWEMEQKVYCSGENTGCDHEDKPTLRECSDCPYMTTIEPKC